MIAVGSLPGVDDAGHRRRRLPEHGRFRETVSCAGVAIPAGNGGTCLAVGISTRGLDLPEFAVSRLCEAATDLRNGMIAAG